MNAITRFAQTILLSAAVLIVAGCGGGSGGSGTPIASNPGAGSNPPPNSAPQDPAIDADATSFYFSYDESASTASRDLSLFALDLGRKPEKVLGRPYEFLNAEVFDSFDAQPAGDFAVSMTLRRGSDGDTPFNAPDGDLYVLGVNVAGPTLPLTERRNLVLTILVDTSGSMQTPYASETRNDVRSLLDVVKYGLTRIRPSLKAGDILNLVTFSSDAQVIAEGLDATTGAFEARVNELVSNGSTDIGRGVDLAYEVANRTFDPDKANRVLLLTDAFVNTGELDPDVIAAASVRGDLEGIRFSGIGIGAGFNDAVLNSISDAGKGSYSAMIMPNDAERLFTADFSRFIEVAATKVRFRLDYPQALDQLRSFGEEISTDPEEVQPVNFSYDSSQFFVELFKRSTPVSGTETVTLSIEYTDASGETQNVSVVRTIDELLTIGTDALDAAVAVVSLAELIGERFSCEEVQASRLYQEQVQSATYALYRQNIDRFCGL
ncbi:MAG: VWA domain-containing protein [Burkholderiaceae bacterium]